MTAVRIAVLSDTQLPRKGRDLPPGVRTALEEVDLILHCGDLNEPPVLAALRSFAPVEAVAGEHDAGFDPPLPDRRVLELEGYRIGLLHGHESGGAGDPGGGQLAEWALAQFRRVRPLDCVLFGHAGGPYVGVHPGEFAPGERRFAHVRRPVLLLNPGFAGPDHRVISVGYLELRDGTLQAEVRMFTYPRTSRVEVEC